MTDVHTSLTIAAPPERVWAVLTDFAAYPRWTNIISRARAELREGATIRFRIKIEAAPELGFAARIVRCQPGRELTWRGGAPSSPTTQTFAKPPAPRASKATHRESGDQLKVVAPPNGGSPTSACASRRSPLPSMPTTRTSPPSRWYATKRPSGETRAP